MTLRERIDDLLDLGNLTKWEDSFLVSLSYKVDRGHQLSEREEDIVEKIEQDRL